MGTSLRLSSWGLLCRNPVDGQLIADLEEAEAEATESPALSVVVVRQHRAQDTFYRLSVGSKSCPIRWLVLW
jgi:hypothetical protein